MRFLVRKNRSSLRPTHFPLAALQRSNWDDYGFKTTFTVTLHLSPTEIYELEEVKILHRLQTEGRTPVPDGRFDELDADYCSLGQSMTYYEQLNSLGEDIYRPFLEGLRDAAFSQAIRSEFEDHEGFQSSLMRFDAASQVLAEAPALFGFRERTAEESKLFFDYAFPDKAKSAEFAFDEASELPGRIAVVVGYNGSGKTRLLANLARLTFADREEATKKKLVDEVGYFMGTRPEFSSVIAVSYSAFDTFELPQSGYRSVARSYVYCGLRRVTGRHRGSLADDPDPYGEQPESVALKDITEIELEFHEARHRVLGIRREPLLRAATEVLLQEPSFQTTVSLPDIAASREVWEQAFPQLSSGHKIALNIAVQLCAYLQPRSLVLFDEPELHLHPPLVAALLRTVLALLEEQRSFAIVATHSPVVLQEVPASRVLVLRRSFDELSVESPEIETFGENVGLLTRHVFSLDSSKTDFEGVLERLAREHSIDEIDGMFELGLSAQARLLVLSIQRSLGEPGPA